jgi:putative aldouronate transport system substrate-binding protein
MKKLLVFAIVLLMALSACGGGGGSAVQQSGGPTGDAGTVDTGGLAPYVIDYFMLTNFVSSEIPAVEEAANAIFQPKYNATVKVTMLDWGSWHTVMNTMLNAGEKADVVFTADWWNFSENVANNFFLPLNDLMNTYAAQTVQQLGSGFINGSQVRGVNYGIPTDKELAVNGGFMWNKTLADKYGLVPDPSWKSYRDWVPFLEVIKENEPNVVPIMTTGGHAHINDLSLINYDIGFNANYKDDPTLIWLWEAPFYVDEMRVIRDMYLAGYISRDALNADNDWEHNHLTMGTFFVMSMPLKPGKGKSVEMMTQALVDVEYDEFETYPLLVDSRDCAGSMLAIPVTSGDPARAMMFINELHTNPEFTNIFAWGVEGLTYEVVQTSPVKLVRAIDGNTWTSAIQPWTIGNQFSHFLADHEPLDKYDLLRATKVGVDAHISNGYRFDPSNWLDTITAIGNAKDEYAGMIRVGAIDTDEGLAALIAAAEAAGFRAYFEAVKADFEAWLAAR